MSFIGAAIGSAIGGLAGSALVGGAIGMVAGKTISDQKKAAERFEKSAAVQAIRQEQAIKEQTRAMRAGQVTPPPPPPQHQFQHRFVKLKLVQGLPYFHHQC